MGLGGGSLPRALAELFRMRRHVVELDRPSSKSPRNIRVQTVTAHARLCAGRTRMGQTRRSEPGALRLKSSRRVQRRLIPEHLMTRISTRNRRLLSDNRTRSKYVCDQSALSPTNRSHMPMCSARSSICGVAGQLEPDHHCAASPITRPSRTRRSRAATAGRVEAIRRSDRPLSGAADDCRRLGYARTRTHRSVFTRKSAQRPAAGSRWPITIFQ